MRAIDADRLLQHTKFYNLKNGNRAIDEIDILHAQTVKAIPISEGATNGDMIKAMFPNIESRLDEKTGVILVKWADGTTKTFKASWWNSPYKKSEE